MKVLHVCPLYFPSVGGNQIHIQSLSEKLSELGHEVHVFTANAGTRYQFEVPSRHEELLPVKEIINQVQVRRFPINHFLFNLLTRDLYRIRGGVRFIKTMFKDTIEYWKLGPCVSGIKQAIGRLKPDLILAVMENSFTTYVCYKAKLKYGIPLVFMPITHIADQRAFHRFLPNIYQEADRLIACTDFEKNQLIQRGVDAEKIVVLPPGLAPGPFQGSDANRSRTKYQIPDRLTVAYIGRQGHLKGIETLIKSMKTVWEKFPDVQLLLAGQADERFVKVMDEEIVKLSQQQRRNVVNIGPFNDQDKKDLFAAVDIVVMASNVDCFGMVYLEAWAGGKPVIACRNTPQETVIDHGTNGLLVEYDNQQELADALLNLLKDKPRRLSMGESGRQKFLREYNLDHYGRRLQCVYQDVLEPKGKQ